MGLILDFNIEQSDDGSFFTVYDTTGIYDAVTNPGGYGNPPNNPDVSDFISATLTLKKLNRDGLFETVLTENVYPTIPNALNQGYVINQQLEDGYYECVLEIEDGITLDIIEKTKYFTFYASSRCCFKKAALALDGCGGACKEKKLNLIELHIFLDAIEASAEDTSLSNSGGIEVYKNIEAMKKLCTKCGCGC
jgi:hypothetical protein